MPDDTSDSDADASDAASPDPETTEPFSSGFEEEFEQSRSFEGPEGTDVSGSFALDMARFWVQEHQKASMLGAFAVGVFVGAMLRK